MDKSQIVASILKPRLRAHIFPSLVNVDPEMIGSFQDVMNEFSAENLSFWRNVASSLSEEEIASAVEEGTILAVKDLLSSYRKDIPETEIGNRISSFLDNFPMNTFFSRDLRPNENGEKEEEEDSSCPHN